MNFVEVLKTIGPAILLANPTTAPYASLILAGIRIAEDSQKKGAEKKSIALNAVELGANTANVIAGAEVVNKSKAVEVADIVIDLIVEVVNNLMQKEDSPKPIPGVSNFLPNFGSDK